MYHLSTIQNASIRPNRKSVMGGSICLYLEMISLTLVFLPATRNTAPCITPQ